MASNKQPLEFEIGVDGEIYVWWLQRQPAWSSDTGAWRGMALGARHAEGQRDVVIEFPGPAKARFGGQQLKPQQINQDLVVRAIASAVAAGWDPHSRGKTVTVEVDETGG
ncbi:MAG: hypothetical protein U1E50_12285 [Caulobacteraceae bacterium]